MVCLLKIKILYFELRNMIKSKKILSIDNSFFKKELKSKMYNAADKELFELASEYKDSLEALSILEQKQVVQLENNKNIDVFGIIQDKEFLFVSIMFL